jgi:RNA polymerase sigma factor (sigma-70 family)
MKEQASSATEEYLWKAFREGSENALDLIYGKMFPVLFHYGYHLCRDEEQVKDCIQNIFVEIWQKRDQVKEVHSLKHYFLKIMRRKLFRTLESKRNEETRWQSIGLAENGDHPNTVFPDEQHLDAKADSASVRRIKACIGKLTDRKKEVILLKFYENLTYAEISEVMGLKDAKYARQLVYRSLDELRKNLTWTHDVSLASYTLSILVGLLWMI